jgi:arsenate reductase (thioredoxin)
MKNKENMLPALVRLMEQLEMEFDQISEERKALLQELADFVAGNLHLRGMVMLNFICTHNSRRSHISQIWAQAAAFYYEVAGVKSYSGGTEATAFNPRAVRAMQQVGFDIKVEKEGENPLYRVQFATNEPPMQIFSKKYDDFVNPKVGFCAIMTCDHADENCPVIIGSVLRLPIRYQDPKAFDDTPQEQEKYLERVRQIGRELLYAFSLIRK